jgi:uncharacterized membrane protein YqgA involved in biofilm formation
MIGTILNVITIVVGGLLGTFLGGRLPEKLRQSVVTGLGLFTLAFGVQMFLKTQNMMVVVGSLLVGILLGEWWKIEPGLQVLAGWLETRVNRGNGGGDSRARFIRGFLTASLLFVIGPMAILGSIEDGLSGNYQVLAIKAILDGFAALAFASSLGIGVVFSALPILIYQGGITLLAAQVQAVVTAEMMAEMSAVGGILLMGIAVGSLLELRPVRTGNFIPALFIAPLVVAVLVALGIK